LGRTNKATHEGEWGHSRSEHSKMRQGNKGRRNQQDGLGGTKGEGGGAIQKSADSISKTLLGKGEGSARDTGSCFPVRFKGTLIR